MRSVLILAFFLQSVFVSAQDRSRYVDSLVRDLKIHREDKARNRAYTELSWHYRLIDIGLASAYADSSIALSRQLNNQANLWSGLNNKAIALSHLGKQKECFEYYLKALEVAEKNKFRRKEAHTLFNIGTFFRDHDDYKTAKEYILKASDIYTELKDTAKLISIYSGLGGNYGYQDSNKLALFYYTKAFDLARAINDSSEMGFTANNVGNCYYYLNDPKKAKEYYFKSILYHESGGPTTDLASSYANYAYMVNEDGDHAGARTYYMKALAISKITKDKAHLIRVYQYLAEMFMSAGDYKQAYYYSDTSHRLKDSVALEHNSQAIHEMGQKFDSEKKRLEIANLGKENELKEKQNRVQRMLLIVVGLALVIVAALALWAYRQYRQKQQANLIIEEQKKAIEEKQKELLDSIYYARRIQRCLITNEKAIDKALKRLNKA